MRQPQERIYTPRKYIQSLKIVFSALLFGQLGFALVMLFVTENQHFNMSSAGNPFLIILPIIAISAILISQLFFKQTCNQLVKKETLKQKFFGYQVAFIVKSAIIEIAVLIGIVVFSVDGNLFFLTIVGVLLLYFVSNYPNPSVVEQQLQLTSEETIQFHKMDEEVR